MLELNEIFLKLFNMSISASWLVFAILVFRLVLKKSPKWVSCCLWALVGVRLVNPFSFESILSLIPSAETVNSENFFYSQSPTITTGVQSFNSYVNPIISESFAPTPGASVNPTQILGFVLSSVWLIGMAVMFLYALISFLRLKKTVAASVNVKENIYVCDEVKSPFILGIIKSKIYIPSYMDEGIMNYVIAHETAHLKRRDYLWKPIGFLLLSVYWFNPVVWLSYILLCRDIELACDEKVIRDMQTGDKKAYSEALLSCSVSQRMITACPVAFGEVGVKKRIKSVLNYKKPAFWVILVALIASAAIGVCFMTDPVAEKEDKNIFSDEVMSIPDTVIIENAGKTYFEITQFSDIENIVFFLQNLELEKKDKVDDNTDLSYENTIEIKNESDDNIKIYFTSDEKNLWIYDYKTEKHSSVYEIKNPQIAKDYFENEEFLKNETIWTFNPASSASSHAWLTFFFDEVEKLEKVEANFGKAQIDDVLKNAVIWMPSVDEDFDEATVMVHAFRKNHSKVVFDIQIKKVGHKIDLTTFYSIIPGEGISMEVKEYSEYVFTKPEVTDESDITKPQRVDCYDDNTFTWFCNPMAGGTWWYETTFTVPEGYEIVSADATSGTARVEELYYGEPDGEKCAKWSPYMNEKTESTEDTILTVGAEKDGKQFNMQIKVSLSGADGETGEREYELMPVNCNMTEKGQANYEIKPIPIEELDTAVSQAIIHINSNKNWLGECPAEGHIILGKEEEKDVTKVYLLERFSSYGFENGWFIEVGGHSTACVMSFAKMDGGYVFWSADYTEDGAHLDDSIKRLFPLKYRKRALNPTDADSKSMDAQCEKYAKAYLREKVREAKIGSYGDVPRIWLTDLGVSVKVSNKLLEMKGMTNACEVGYYERDGVTYRTSYCEEEKIIIYTQSHPEKPNFECVAIDAETGKEVPFKDEYLEKAKTYEDYMSEGFKVKQQEYTTKAVTIIG